MRHAPVAGIGLIVTGLAVLALYVVPRFFEQADVTMETPSPAATASRTSHPAYGPPATLELPVSAADAQLAGRVFDANNKAGLPGVHVIARALAAPSETRSALTDDNGFYFFEGLPKGEYAVRHDGAPEYPPLPEHEAARARILSVDDTIIVDFPVTIGIVVRGKVVDATGDPVPGATVTGVQSRLVRDDWRETARSVSSDEHGAFELAAFREDADLFVYAVKDDLTSAWRGPLNPEADPLIKRITHLVLELHPGGRIAGVAVTTSSRTLPFARIDARKKDGQSPMSSRLRTLTGDRGEFELVGVPAGIYELSVVPREFRYVSGQPPLDVELVEGQVLRGLRLVFDDKDQLAIDGRAVNEQYEPIEGVLIQVEGGGGRYELTADREGRFRVPYLARAVYALTAFHPDYAEEKRDVPADTTGVEFVLKQYKPIRGRVVEKDGEGPVTRFRVITTTGLFRNTIHVSDPEGRFAIDPAAHYTGRIMISTLNLEKRFIIRVEADGYVSQDKRVPWDAILAAAPEEFLYELRREGPLPLFGRVVDDAGEGVPGAEVYSDDSVIFRTIQTVHARSDGEGRFTIARYVDDMNPLHARHPDYLTSSQSVSMQSVERGEEILITLKLPGSIQGVVRRNGLPVPGLTMYCRSLDNLNIATQAWVSTEADGSYTIARAPVGKVRVDAGGPGQGYAKEAIVVPGETTIVDFNLPAANSRVEGHVTLGGQPPPGTFSVIAYLSTTDGQPYTDGARNERPSNFYIDNVPAGSGVLIAEASDGENNRYRRRIEITVPEGETLYVPIELIDTLTLTGIVEGNDKYLQIRVFPSDFDVNAWYESLPNYQCVEIRRALQSYDPTAIGNTLTMLAPDEQTFEMTGIEPGEYIVLIVACREMTENAQLAAHLIELETNASNIFHFNAP